MYQKKQQFINITQKLVISPSPPNRQNYKPQTQTNVNPQFYRIRIVLLNRKIILYLSEILDTITSIKQNNMSTISNSSIRDETIISQKYDNFSCHICFQKYDENRKAPMMLCFYQHIACNSCSIQLFDSIDKRRGKCPFCKTSIRRQDLKPFRLLMETKEVVSSLKNESKKSKQELEKEKKKVNQLLKRVEEEAKLSQNRRDLLSRYDRALSKQKMKANQEKQRAQSKESVISSLQNQLSLQKRKTSIQKQNAQKNKMLAIQLRKALDKERQKSYSKETNDKKNESLINQLTLKVISSREKLLLEQENNQTNKIIISELKISLRKEKQKLIKEQQKNQNNRITINELQMTLGRQRQNKQGNNQNNVHIINELNKKLRRQRENVQKLENKIKQMANQRAQPRSWSFLWVWNFITSIFPRSLSHTIRRQNQKQKNNKAQNTLN